MTKLEELRNRLREEQEKTKNSGNPDKSNYPFWNITEGDFSTIRFLPDGDDQSEFFWVNQFMIRLPFAGIRGKSTKPVTVKVPCMQMYGETCPVMEEIKPLWKTDEDTARIYYKKKSHIFHGFVRKDGSKEEGSPENPIRKLVLNSKLFNIVHSGLLDVEMEDIPTDYVKGTDFNIYKTKTGQWADYTTSRWARKTSALTEAEAEAIEKFGLPKLSSYLPKKPTAEALAVIMEMFADSMSGEAYDLEKYGDFYRPFGVEGDSAATPTTGAGKHSVKTTVTAPADEDADEVPFETEEKSTKATPAKEATATSTTEKPKQSVQDLLAAIKQKKASN